MSRMPPTISRPMFRRFSHFANCLSVILLIVDSLFHLFKEMRWYILAHVLSVKRQHPDLAASASQVVNDTQPAAFAAPRNRPSQLSHAAGARDYGAGFGVLIQVLLELRVFVVIEIVLERLR